MGWFKRKGGGGFLAGENGTLVSIAFDSKVFGEGDSAYESTSAELKILQDGQTEPVQQFLNVGFLYEDQSVEGAELKGGAAVLEGSEFYHFVQSALDKGAVTEEELADGTDFSALAGKRYTFAKVPNVDRQMAAGRKKLGKKAADATDEVIMKAGRRQDQNDKTKFYNHDMLTVGAYLGEAEAPKKGAKTTAKAAAPKTVAAKGGKANGAAKTVDGDDFEAADAMLVALLTSTKGNVIPKGSIKSAVVRKALETDMPNDERDTYRELFNKDEYLARENGWVYSPDAKNQPIALA
jgi:hypothetical protein